MSIQHVSSAAYPVNQTEDGDWGVEREGFDLLQPYSLLPAYWRPSTAFFANRKRDICIAVGRLSRAGLANKENLTRFIGLEERQCDQFCQALQFLTEGGVPLDQRTFEFLYEQRKNDWGHRIPRLYFRLEGNNSVLNPGILGEIFETLLAPENREHAASIADGWLSLQTRELFNRYREDIVRAQGAAGALGEGLAIVHGPRGLDDATVERCSYVALQYPKHARTFARAILGLQSQGLLIANIPVMLEVHPEFAEDVSYVLFKLAGCTKLIDSEREECIATLVSGDPKGEHAGAISRGMERIAGPEMTLEQFRNMAATLPVSNPFSETGLK